MAGKKRKNTQGKPRQPSRKEVSKTGGNGMAFAVLLWLLAAVLLLAVFGANAGLQKFVCGIGGSWYLGVPAISIWLGILSASAAKGKKLDKRRICMNLAAILLAYTARHMFAAKGIIEGSQLKSSGYYINFIARSYRERTGGGALGALLCWPIYQYLGGCWVGFFLCLLGIVACMTVTGRTQKVLSWGEERYAQYARERESRQPREPIRDEALEHAFDDEEIAEKPRRVEKPSEVLRDMPKRQRKPKLYNANLSEEEITRRESKRTEEAEQDPLFPEKVPEAEQVETAEALPTNIQEEAARSAEALPTEKSEDAPKTVGSDIPEYLQRKKPAREEVAEESPTEEEIHAEAEKYRIEPEKYEPDEEEIPAELPKLPQMPLTDAKPYVPPRREEKKQTKPELEEEEEIYNYPPISLLNLSDNTKSSASFKQDEEKANRLIQTLLSFGIETKLTGIAHGPVVTRYELQPAAGVKVSRITALTDDIALRLAAESVRLEAPIPGKEAVGVEVPNDERETVSLRDVLESEEAKKHPSKIAIGLGKDNSGRFIVADIAKMPHVLIAGQTGSGKSVCINSLIVSILYRATPDEVKLILIDPKVVELSVYNGIPHLIAPVVTDPKKAASALDWAVSEMMGRYKRFAERGVRDIKGYNKKLREDEKPMPQIVIVIDELSDLMMVAPGDVEDAICRLAQLARAAGMHIVIATQRPSVNVITGIIKANIPTRIAFAVASQIDSRTMIDHGGAEKLLGRGDMLYVPSGMKPMRVQGVWVSDEEVERVVKHIKSSSAPEYDEDMLEHMENSTKTDAEKEEANDEYDKRLPEAVEIVLESGQASASMLQRRMKVGYARAGRMIDEMEQRGIIAPPDGVNKSKPRDVLITREQFQRMFEDGV